MPETYVISYDLGTSGIKVALVSGSGRLLACAQKGYPLLTPRPGWAEQDPMAYWKALCECTRNVMDGAARRPEAAAGISICTQWKGIIPVDAQGQVLHNSLIWLDARAQEEAEYLNLCLNTRMFTGQSYWARLMWLKNNHPDIYNRADCIFEANSFLRWKMTGLRAMDISNDFIHSLDPAVDGLYDNILKAAGIDRNKFPPLVDSTAQVGMVTRQAGLELGLPDGIPVFAGCSDIPAIAIGAGCGKQNMAHAYFGTSGWVGAVVKHEASLVETPSCALNSREDIVLYGMQSVGLALDWTLKQFYGAELQTMGSGIFAYLEEELKDMPPGSQRLLATPWLCGELPPLCEKARIAFVNANALHTRRHFVNAMMESICYSILCRVRQCEAMLGRPLPDITVVGGGASGGHWMQILADVLQIPVLVPEDNKHAGAIGGAYCALMGLGLCGAMPQIGDQVRMRHRYEPRAENWPEHQRMHEAFVGLFDTLKPVFERLQA